MAEYCYAFSLWTFVGFALLAPLSKNRFVVEVRVFTSLSFLPVFWCLSQVIRHGLDGRELDLTIPLSFLSAQFMLGAVMFRLYWQKVYLDELTGLPNRRALNERLPRLRSDYCIAMFDVDHFKNFNDTYGHEQGDHVLRFVSGVLENEFGAHIYRYGGEEFCAIFEGIDVGRVAKLVDAARERLATRHFTIRASPEMRKATSSKNRSGSSPAKPKATVTLSAGVASASPSLKRPEDVLIAADAALYQAKQNGRDRVVVAAYGPRKKKSV